MKIMFVVPGNENDGPQSMSFVKRLAKALIEHGEIVEIFYAPKSSNLFILIKQIISLRYEIKKSNIELIVAQYGTYVGALVAFFAPSPKIINYRGSDLNPTPSEKKLYVISKHILSHISSFFVDGIICVSNDLSKKIFSNAPKIVIPSITDVNHFVPLNQTDCRVNLGWNISDPIAVFFSGNNPLKKRTDIAYKVRRYLKSQGSSIELKIIDSEIPLHEMPIYLNASDCLLYVSDYEGSPNLIRDACSCNLPIVSVEVGDVSDVLSDVYPSAIVTRSLPVISLELDKITMLRARSNGRTKAHKYCEKAIVDKTLTFYRRILGNL